MKRFIEESFPVKEVGEESAEEKNPQRGHISTLHTWWAWRPLASSRATAYAALISAPDNIDEWNLKRNFITDLSKPDGALNSYFIEKAREEILENNGGVPPRVLDPFGGSGAIPLEALRLGCETYSNDLNPVAVLIQKCTLEYPQKYGRLTDIPADGMLAGMAMKNPLFENVKKWGAWTLAEAKKELAQFYPLDEDGAIPIGYIWARTIPCQNPSCRVDIPLMRQFWLANKPKKKVAIYPYGENGDVKLKIIGDGYDPIPQGFNPTKGSISRAVAECPLCGGMVEAKLTKQLFQMGKAGERMVAVVMHVPGERGKRYRVATKKDLAVFEAIELILTKKRNQLKSLWGIDPVPEESLPPKDSHRAVGSQLPLYNFKNWGDLFNVRQKLTLMTFVEKIKTAYQEMVTEGVNSNLAKAVVSYLALTFDRMAMSYNSLTGWQSGYEKMGNMFPRQTLSMVWDYAEPNAIGGRVRSWESLFKDTLHVISAMSRIKSLTVPKVSQSSATNLSYPDNFFDAVFTDPPYYDNVPYSYLSDFFYVWLKRTVADIYPELFSTPLTPKTNEIVAYTKVPVQFKDGTHFFETMLKKSFQEICRVLKPNGIVIVVYAHKTTEGWETLINSLLDSGLVVTGAWPLRTERKGRMNAMETAALASSIYIVGRKMDRQPTGFYNEVKAELTTHLNARLHRLWAEGLGGADFFIAAIGSAIEVFGKYEQVMNYEGNIIRADRLLDDVREIATDYAVHQILQNGFAGEISNLTRFYVLWRWEYKEARVHFDEARKLAQSCGVDLARKWDGRGFIVKEKAFYPRPRSTVSESGQP